MSHMHGALPLINVVLLVTLTMCYTFMLSMASTRLLNHSDHQQKMRAASHWLDFTSAAVCNVTALH